MVRMAFLPAVSCLLFDSWGLLVLLSHLFFYLITYLVVKRCRKAILSVMQRQWFTFPMNWVLFSRVHPHGWRRKPEFCRLSYGNLAHAHLNKQWKNPSPACFRISNCLLPWKDKSVNCMQAHLQFYTKRYIHSTNLPDIPEEWNNTVFISPQSGLRTQCLMHVR